MSAAAGGLGAHVLGVEAVALDDLGTHPLRGGLGRDVAIAPLLRGLPRVGDVVDAGVIPPLGMAGGLQLRDRRGALAVDASLELAGGLVALGLGLAQLALALADALLGEPAGRGDRESHPVVEDLGDAVCLGLGHVDHFLLVVACVRLAGQARS